MSDYGLLSRKLTLGVKYEDSPETYANADVPVFMVGRQQLCELFGLYGSRKPNPSNFVCDLESLEDRIQDCNYAYALVCYGHWADGTPSRMVTLCNAYETLEQCSSSVGFLFGLDAFNMLKHPKGVIYDYEIWQIWDDYNLYARWDMSADCCMRETGQNHKFSQAWRLSYEDMADYHDYLSSLKPFRAYIRENGTKSIVFGKPYSLADEVEGSQVLKELREAGELERKSRTKETCYFCGCFLPVKNYFVRYKGEMKLVCRDCFNAYVLDDCEVLRYRSADTFICDHCGRTMQEEYYAQTLTGTYCTECKAQHVNLGDDVSNLPEAERVAIAVDIESADADWPRSCEHGDTYYTEGHE